MNEAKKQKLDEKIQQAFDLYQGKTKLGVKIINTEIRDYEDVVIVIAEKEDHTKAVFMFTWNNIYWSYLVPEYSHILGLRKTISAIEYAEVENKRYGGKW